MATTKTSGTRQSKSKKATAKTSTAKSRKASPSSTSKQTRPRAASKATAAKRFRVRLEPHPGTEAAWFTVPFDAAKVFGTRARVPVRCTVNGFPFRTSIFPKGDGCHYMVVNREVRAAANVRAGETVSMTMARDTEPRVITPPAELARALKSNKAARAAWDKLSYSHQKEYARAVEEAKRPETRERRIEKAIAELSSAKKPRE